MGLSGNARKRPGWFEELGIRIRTSGGVLNYVLFKLGLPLADLARPRRLRDVPGVLVGGRWPG
jgi:hypothetical protein